MLADLARLEVGEKPGNGVDALGIPVSQENAGVDPDPESPKKGVEAEEKEVTMQFPQRSETTDCAFYMKTGECKFGSACKFNHPPKRRKPRVVISFGVFFFWIGLRIYLLFLVMIGEFFDFDSQVRAKKGSENVQVILIFHLYPSSMNVLVFYFCVKFL